MNPNLSGSDQLAVLAVISPDTRLGGGFPSLFANSANWNYFLMVAQVGAFGASATFDARLQQATDSSGTTTKNITGKAITTLAAAGGDNKQIMINLRPDELDLTGGFNWIRMVLNTATASTYCSAILYGMSGRNSPASVSNIASVVQIIG